MAHDHSYGATLKNNITENSAINFLLEADSRFRRPNKEERKEILNLLGLSKTFSRAFDLVFLPSPDVDSFLSISVEKLVLVELKTTQKKLINNPEGFFFGATENEFQLADKLGKQYYFCFVSLHPESKSYKMLSLNELNSRIKTKRVQYQINL